MPALPGGHALRYRYQQGGNVIDLSDPGILSYKKEKMSDGREKITIIRKEVKEENATFDVRVGTEKGDVSAPRVVRGYKIAPPVPLEKIEEIEIKKETEKK